MISPDKPVFSIDVTTFVWQGFLQEATTKWAINDFAAPDGLVQAKVDAVTGLKPTAGEPRRSTSGSSPARSRRTACPRGCAAQAVLDLAGIYEGRFNNWMTADLDWIDPRPDGPGHGRRRQPDADRVLLQRRVPAVRAVVGRARRGPRLRGCPARR